MPFGLQGSSRTLRVTAIDDDPDFEPVLDLCLEHVQGMSFDLSFYENATQALKGIEAHGTDLILLDYQLDHTSGLDVLRELRDEGLDQPVIALTGRGDTKVAVELMKSGASDYINKANLNPPVLRRSIRVALKERAQALALQESREALAYSEMRLRAVLQNAWDAIIVTQTNGEIASANRAAHTIFGFRQGTLIGMPLSEILPGPASEARDPNFCWRDLSGRPREWQGETRRQDPIQVEMSVAHIPLPDHELITVVVRDITQRKLAEERLTHTMAALEQSRDDLLSVLNNLHLGAALTDEWGNIAYLNDAAERLLNLSQTQVIDRHWERLWEVSRDQAKDLRAMWDKPASERRRVPIEFQPPDQSPRRVEVDFRDDPRDHKRRVLFFYDVSEVHELREKLDDKARFDQLVGRSDSMQDVYEMIVDVAAFDATVLVIGETGTGKELVARAIHNASPRRDRPFIAVNTAGLSDSLLASQLFGHVRGAFTGAHEARKGVFVTAQGGTVFLDEIGDISPSVQTSLLRVLQEREITRVGETLPRKIDVRVVAATHRDLNEEVRADRFRLDLLYRIRVASIELPPLRDRPGDVPLLAKEFLRQARASTGKPVMRVSDPAMRQLVAYAWPGNVREMKSAIEFGVIRCKHEQLRPEDLPTEILQYEANPATVQPATAHTLTLQAQMNSEDRRDRILTALEQAKGNRSAAARLLGVSRATFYRHLERLGMDLDK